MSHQQTEQSMANVFSRKALVFAAAGSIALWIPAAGAAQAEVQLKQFAERLVGTWERFGPTRAPGGAEAYVRSTISFNDGVESVATDAFADESGTQPILSYRSSGPYRLGKLSAAVPGAVEVDMTNDSSLLTVHVDDPELLTAIGLDDCAGLRVGVARDVSDGCAAPIFAVSNCVDQDLLHLSDDGQSLRFGEQGGDRCVTRPTRLDNGAYTRAK